MMTDETRAALHENKTFARAAQMRADVILKYKTFPIRIHMNTYNSTRLTIVIVCCNTEEKLVWR